MANLDIEGIGRVEVGDDFLSLSTEQQSAAVDEIAATMRQSQPVQAEATSGEGPRIGEPLLRSISEATLGVPAEPFDAEGNPRFEVLGDLERTAGGDFIRTASGEQLAISRADFITEDPKTGKLIVMALPERSGFERIEAGSKALLTGMAAGAPTRIAGGPMAPGLTSRGARQAEIATAAERQGVEPGLATLSENRVVKGAAATLREFPGSSGTIQRAAEREIGQVAARAEDIAGQFSGAARPEQAGRSVRQGLEEFRASAGREFDLRGVDAGELAEFIAKPARLSSFSKKAAALYEKVGRMVPDNVRMVPGRSLTILDRFAARFDNPQLQQQFENGFFGKLRRSLQNKQNLGYNTWRDLRQLRSEVRRLKADKLSEAERTISNAEIKQLESALTEDILELTRQAGGDKAVKALRGADKFYRSGIQRLDQAKKILKIEADEQLYGRIIGMAGTNRSADIARLNAVRRSLGDEAWRDVAAVAIRRLGQPTPGAAAAAIDGFSVNTFVTNFNKLSPQGRRVLFETTGQAELAKALNDLATVASSQKQTAQFSVPTGGGMGIGRGGALVALGQIFSGLDGFMTAMASIVGANVLARLMTSPKAVRALTNTFRATRGSDAAQRLPFAVNRLRLVLQSDEGLRPLADRLTEIIDNEGQGVAGESENQ